MPCPCFAGKTATGANPAARQCEAVGLDPHPAEHHMPGDHAIGLRDQRDQRIAVGFQHPHQFGLPLVTEPGSSKGCADSRVDGLCVFDC
ncbi:hypothetical protein [Sphingopyxis sp. PET50]|uniref:hypothetical protein n=1 Tax=Sphingopyxis sp. PET50 TaxID=2976533 RepID=UPI0021AE8C63|nr:hypothetical protein [Sphingopyxis sp. PET50]